MKILFIILLFGCVAATTVIPNHAQFIESNKAKLDPDAIIKEWRFIGSDARGPGQVQLDWCPNEQFFTIANYYENPDRNGFPQEVVMILNLERQRPEYITWEEEGRIWVFERFCQKEWVQRLPTKDHGV